MRLFLLSLLLFVFPMSAGAMAGGTWSNIRVDDTNGDAHGMRVTFQPGPPPVVIFTECDGPCRAPVTVPAQVQGNRFDFTVTLGKGGVTHFTAEIRDDGGLRIGPAGKPWTGRLLRPEREG